MGACCSSTNNNKKEYHKSMSTRKSKVQEANLDESKCDDKPVIPLSYRIPAQEYIEKGEYNQLNKLISSGELNVNEYIFDGCGKTPLLYAVQKSTKEIVELLLDKGADINLCEKSTGNSALYIASVDIKNDIVSLLIKNSKLDYNLKNNNHHDIFEALDEFFKGKEIPKEKKDKLNNIIKSIKEAKERSHNVEILDEQESLKRY